MKRDPQEISNQATDIAIAYCNKLKGDYANQEEVYKLISSVFNHLTNRHTPETKRYYNEHPDDVEKVLRMLKDNEVDRMRLSEVADAIDFVRMFQNPDRTDPTSVEIQKELGLYIEEVDRDRPLSLDREQSIRTAYGAQTGSGCVLIFISTFAGYLLLKSCLQLLFT